MTISNEAKEALKSLEKKFWENVSKERAALEERLVEELNEELHKVANEHQIVFLSEIYENEYEPACYPPCPLDKLDENSLQEMESIAEMFINNAITQSSIWSDPSGDWDGSNREGDFHRRACSEQHIRNLLSKFEEAEELKKELKRTEIGLEDVKDHPKYKKPH